MRIIWWLFYIVLFVVALGFALANPEVTQLRFFASELVWEAPLVVFLLAFFAVGVIVGLLAALPALFRARRDASRLRHEVKLATRPAETVVLTPAPTPINQLGGGSRSGLSG